MSGNIGTVDGINGAVDDNIGTVEGIFGTVGDNIGADRKIIIPTETL